MKILGISGLHYDSAAVISINGKVIAAAQEERFTRLKHDESFPENTLKFFLSEASLKLDDIDTVGFYDKPLLKFERILETHLFVAPKGFVSFVKSIPIWMKEKEIKSQFLKK